jgi:hypothetical protein
VFEGGRQDHAKTTNAAGTCESEPTFDLDWCYHDGCAQMRGLLATSMGEEVGYQVICDGPEARATLATILVVLHLLNAKQHKRSEG